MTPAEILFWNQVKAKNFEWLKFQRQTPIYVFTEDSWLDRFIIPDFVCFEKNLIIEIDGWIHDLEEIYLLDKEKEKLLEWQWYKIVRFKNEEVLSDVDTVRNSLLDLT